MRSIPLQRLCEEFSLDADEEDYLNFDEDSEDDDEGSFTSP